MRCYAMSCNVSAGMELVHYATLCEQKGAERRKEEIEEEKGA